MFAIDLVSNNGDYWESAEEFLMALEKEKVNKSKLRKLRKQSDVFYKLKTDFEAKTRKDIKKKATNKVYAILMESDYDYKQQEDRILMTYNPKKDNFIKQKKADKVIEVLKREGFIENINNRNFEFTAEGDQFYCACLDIKNGRYPGKYLEYKYNEELATDYSKLARYYKLNQEYEQISNEIYKKRRADFENKYKEMFKNRLQREQLFMSIGSFVMKYGSDGCTIDDIVANTGISSGICRATLKKAIDEEYIDVLYSKVSKYYMTIRGICYLSDLISVQNGGVPKNTCDRDEAIKVAKSLYRSSPELISLSVFYYPEENRIADFLKQQI